MVCQKLVGRLGKPFNIYRFRTTSSHPECKRTPFGSFLRKYSLDELPQIFAVVMGHMSIIGPRPLPPWDVASYSSNELLGLSVKPGLICLSEIKRR
jgi:lipopolysaccharide/colanic/teichoic acid biosynthesis glycosyltransferase